MMLTMFKVTQDWQMPVNILVLIVFVFCIARGWRKGFLRSVLSLCSMFLSVWLAWSTEEIFASRISLLPENRLSKTNLFGVDAIYAFFNQMIWFLILFAVFRILFFLLDRILKRLHSVAGIRQISEILGGVFGGIQAVLWCLVFCVIFSTPLFANGSLAIDGTVLGLIRDAGESAGIDPAVPALTGNAFSSAQNGMKKLTEKERKFMEQWLNENGYDRKGEKIQ